MKRRFTRRSSTVGAARRATDVMVVALNKERVGHARQIMYYFSPWPPSTQVDKDLSCKSISPSVADRLRITVGWPTQEVQFDFDARLRSVNFSTASQELENVTSPDAHVYPPNLV
ncbi:ring finger domain protein [Moniliophthora roreri]|nr:ring finger domain protein [Moniliophthora roreri]